MTNTRAATCSTAARSDDASNTATPLAPSSRPRSHTARRPRHHHRARIGREPPRGDGEQRRLAGAGRADEGHHLTRGELERRIRDRCRRAATAARDATDQEDRRVHIAGRDNSRAVPATPPTAQHVAWSHPTRSPRASAAYRHTPGSSSKTSAPAVGPAAAPAPPPRVSAETTLGTP